MSGLKKHFSRLALGIEENFDALAMALRKRLNSDNPLQIVTYRSYGTANQLYVKGRVLKDKGIRTATDNDNVWNNLVSMYKRFESDEVPGARLKINFQNKAYFVITDGEGYFTIDLFTDKPIAGEDMWHELEVELLEEMANAIILSFMYRAAPGIYTILLKPKYASFNLNFQL